MGLALNPISSQTPLTVDEQEGLKIKGLATREELDQFEQQNIETALAGFLGQDVLLQDFLTEKFIKNLHFKMFNQVWKWAGEFRLSDKNIGVSWNLISTGIRDLLDDIRYWLNHETFSQDEIAIRLKHRLVSIHPFPNGNGRHSRLMADIMMEKIFKQAIFSWGALNLHSPLNGQKEYIKALKSADDGDYISLLKFAKS